MNKTLMVAGLILGVASLPACASHPRYNDDYDTRGGYSSGGSFYDYAQVVRVDPIIGVARVSAPRQECWEERAPVYESGYRSATPMILGGIMGGVVGSHVGKGRGRDAAIVAGTVLGGSIGRDHGEYARGGYRTASRERCRTVGDYREEERVEGYHVTYRYKGEDYTTRMDHSPGSRIRVRVSVQPAE